jgi:DNA-binding LacI/PurR family transcriptional regulator
MVAERVGLAACSVSAVLNHTPASRSIPQKTQDRVFRAAAELNYRPNLWARSLRTKRTRLVAAIASDIGLASVARVLAGAQSLLHRKGYLMAVRSLDSSSAYHNMSVELQQRGIEGVVAIDATPPVDLPLPIASVDLDSISLMEPITEDMRSWLSQLGESAAETIIRQIEKSSVPRTNKVAPKVPNAYFGLSHSALGTGVETREPA